MLAYLESMGWFGMLLAACCVVVGGALLVSAWRALVYLADLQEFD